MVVSRTNASKTVHARPIFSAPESADSHQFFAALWCEACELTAYTRRFTSTNVTCLVPSFLSLLRPQEQRPYSTPCPNYCPLGHAECTLPKALRFCRRPLQSDPDC